MIYNLFRLFGAFVSLSLTIFVAAIYETDISAPFFISFSLIFLFATLLKFGLDDLVLQSSSGTVDSKTIFSWIKAILLFSIILIFICIVFFMFIEPNNLDYLFVPLSIPLTIFYSLVGFYFQGRQHFIAATFVSSILMPATFILVSLIDVSNLKILPPLGILLISCFVNCFISCVLIFWLEPIESKNLMKGFHIYLLNQIDWNQQFFLYLNSLIAVFSIHGIIVLANEYLNNSEIVQLNIMLRLCQASTVFILVMNFTFAPKVRKLFLQKNITGINNLYRKNVIFGITLSALISVFFFFFLDFIDDVILTNISVPKKEFWVLWSSFAINLAFGTIGYLYIMMNKAKFSSLISLLVVMLMIVSFFIISPENLICFIIIFALFNALARLILTVNWNVIGKNQINRV